MISALLALSCAAPLMLNTSKYPWNNYDRSELKFAQKRCQEIYKDAPCVKLFKKYNRQQYSVICGEEKK